MEYGDEITSIKELLKQHPEGLTVGAISQEIGVNRNSVAKYLDVLEIGGHVQRRTVGPAKLYRLSHKVSAAALLDATTELVCVTDADGRILQLNETTARALQQEKSALVGTALTAPYPFLREGIAIAARGKEYEEEHEHDGRTLHVKYIPNRFEDGTRGVTLITEDVTERRSAEQQMRLLQRAVEASSGSITIADARKKEMPLVYVNKAFERMTGYSRDEILGRNCRFLQGKQTEEEPLQTIREAFKQEKECTVQLTNYRKNGERFRNELRLSPVFDETGRLTHYVGFQTELP